MERLLIALLLVLTLPGLLTFLPIRARRNLDRGEGPTDTRSKESELWAARKPLERWSEPRDGTRSYPVAHTKWDRCAHLMRELQGRIPSDQELAQWQLTRREYEHFLHPQPASRARPSLTQNGLQGDRDGQAEREQPRM
jgi:hypothetical protein